MSTHAISPIESDPIRRRDRAGDVGRYLSPLGRLCFSLIFIVAAPGHFTAAPVAMAAAHGVPAPSIAVPVSGILCLLGGLSVLFGFRARVGAWLLVIFLVPVTLYMHAFWGVADAGMRQIQQIMFMKNVGLLGGAFLIAYFGAGPVSLDAWTASRHPPESARAPVKGRASPASTS